MNDKTAEQKTRVFNARWYQDTETGLATIRRHPNAATESNQMTPDEVKAMLAPAELERFE